MKERKFRKLWSAICLLAAFVLWTAAVQFVDVQAIGPQGSCVGLAAINGFWHEIIGVNWMLYVITDWLGLIPLGVVLLFAMLGLHQWVTRKNLRKVDTDILILGGYYLAVLAVFLFFEMVKINYRPVLIDGHLETSYPSSTTMLVLCVMPTALMQLQTRLKRRGKMVGRIITVFGVFMVIGRVLAGVHWLTDIIGGMLLSAGLVMLYGFLCDQVT